MRIIKIKKLLGCQTKSKTVILYRVYDCLHSSPSNSVIRSADQQCTGRPLGTWWPSRGKNGIPVDSSEQLENVQYSVSSRMHIFLLEFIISEIETNPTIRAILQLLWVWIEKLSSCRKDLWLLLPLTGGAINLSPMYIIFLV